MKLQKETEPLKSHGKWYQDACGTAFAMELVGERWSMLIIRELMLGGRRFSDLRGSLPGISAKVLTERLTGADDTLVYLSVGDGEDEVQDEIAHAQRLGIRAVPTFVFDGRTAVQGAQPTSAFLQVLEELGRDAALDAADAADETSPDACADGSCAV